MIQGVPESKPRMFFVPSPRLGVVDDVVPERLTAGMNDWIALSRDVLHAKRAAAARGAWRPTSDISEDHNEVHPFGAQYCPALQEMNVIGWVLKWPANGVLKRTAERSWEVHTEAPQFYKHHLMSSFPEGGQSDAISISLGWMIVTPPGWSTLIKNLPNQFAGRHAVQFAEGIVRTDQATVPLQVHAFLPSTAPNEITITRGQPMCVVMPFKRDPIAATVMSDPESVADAVAEAKLDAETFANAPGRYRELYVEQGVLSTLYPKLLERASKKDAGE